MGWEDCDVFMGVSEKVRIQGLSVWLGPPMSGLSLGTSAGRLAVVSSRLPVAAGFFGQMNGAILCAVELAIELAAEWNVAIKPIRHVHVKMYILVLG